MWPSLNIIVCHLDWCQAIVYIISIYIMPGNRLDYEEYIHRVQKQDHMDIHTITWQPVYVADDQSVLGHNHRDKQGKLRNWSEMGKHVDFISTKTKPKQCETTVEQAPLSNSENNT